MVVAKGVTAGDLQAQRDFGAVTDSYRRVEHDLGVYPDRDREARADYLPPPAPEPYNR